MGKLECDYARTTITVPRRLKRRMRAVSKDVNWSAVACRAFEGKLAEVSRQQQHLVAADDAESMAAAVRRLRRLRQEGASSEEYRRGTRAGRRWAMNAATPDQLERIDAFRARMSDEDWRSLFATNRGWRVLAREIEPGRRRPKTIWQQIVEQEETEDLDFFRGFADGAVEFWKEVEPQL